MKNNSQQIINWFPGHMQKASRLIKEQLKLVDYIIEIVDARAVNITSNENFIKEIAAHKPLLKIALKNDLADANPKIKNVLYGSINDQNFRKIVLSEINNGTKPIITKMQKKGIVNPKIYLMVVGLPNVGKSSFINFLAKKKQLIIANQPGVTKKNNWIKINDQIEMMDTPGILFKKINDAKTGYILTLLRCVKWEITPKYEVIDFAYHYYFANYKKPLCDAFKFELDDSFQVFLDNYCNHQKLLLIGNHFDYEKALEKLYKLFSTGLICKMTFN
ncbi:MAG: ribosome biogenesis GTPase YlqF [Mycoplasmoidaceae bacterium]